MLKTVCDSCGKEIEAGADRVVVEVRQPASYMSVTFHLHATCIPGTDPNDNEAKAVKRAGGLLGEWVRSLQTMREGRQ